MAKPDVEGKEGDWFAQLDEELEKKTVQITDNLAEQTSQKELINKSLVEDLFRIWIRFNKINVHFSMAPDPQSPAFPAQFVVFPEQWNFKPDYHFSDLDDASLTDRTQGRVGDSLKAWYYNVDSQLHLRVVFEFCEGEHYYKYAGWKRIFTQYVLLDVPVTKFEDKKYHDILGDVVKTWYESHLRRDREVVLKHIREKYEKGETFTQ